MRAGGAGSGRHTHDGQVVVLGEVARCGAHGAEGLGETLGGGLRDVLVEGAGAAARHQNALDGSDVEGAVERGVGQRGVEIRGVVALAQEQDAAGVMGPVARRRAGGESNEVVRALAHLLKRGAELVEIGRPVASRARVVAVGVELVAAAPWSELVAGDTLEVGGVDEELVLGDAHGHEVRDVVVGHGVAVAGPVHEALDAANAIGDAAVS